MSDITLVFIVFRFLADRVKGRAYTLQCCVRRRRLLLLGRPER